MDHEEIPAEAELAAAGRPPAEEPTQDQGPTVRLKQPSPEPPAVPVNRPGGSRAESGAEDEPTVSAPLGATADRGEREPGPVDDEPAVARDDGVETVRLGSVSNPRGDVAAESAEREPASSDQVTDGSGGEAGTGGDAVPVQKEKRKMSSAAAVIWVLLALFGFTLVVQLRSNDADQGLATARQEDLVRILSDLESRDTRLSAEINGLENSQRQLTSGVAGRQAALADAAKRADELGLLAGTLPGKGPGLQIVVDPKNGQVKASAVLNAVQELRGAGGEVMQIAGATGRPVRIVASTYFVDAGAGAITVDRVRLAGPYTLTVIGSPQTMQTALQIPGGVVASVESDGGSVTMDQRAMVEVTAVRKATNLQYARPVS
jgi:uncharacterized protein YlxW (UPF0749 family)